MQIHPSLAELAYPVDDLSPLKGNPRVGDVQAVVRSYSRFGQRKPIVARHRPDGSCEVTAGNHQLEAARQLGWSEIAVVFTDDDELTAHAFALADNRTADLGSYDDEALAAMIGEIALAPDLMDAASYSLDQLAALEAKGVTPDFDPQDSTPRLDETAERQCPSCGYRWKTVGGDVVEVTD